MSNLIYKVIIGLEIHVQLCTQTKMFCSCGLSFGEQANSRVCPVCLGMPGVLPVMNKKAVEYSILTASALNCKLAQFTKWDRKSYYYPDLPKNYQISQYDLPIGEHGYIEIPLESDQTKKVRILRAHLEEVAGKNVHTSGNYSQVDLNRAGTPLLEIVTEPDMNSPKEVRRLAIELQRIVRYLGVSEADMQKGHMRFEPNVNLVINRSNAEFRTPIVEVKNLNSFKALERSIAYEIDRQLDEFIETGKVLESGNKSTRGWDDANQVTVLQREKEEAHDYRYFPDPDLVPVKVTQEWLDEIGSNLCELPLAQQLRYAKEHGLSDYDAGVLTSERAIAELFEQAVAAGANAKRVCNLLTQIGLKMANEKNCSISELNLSAENIASLAQMIEQGTVGANSAAAIFEAMVQTQKEPDILAEQMNLIQKSDAGELDAIVDQVLEENPQAVDDVKSQGRKSKKARGFLLGQVMQKSKGQANPQVVSEILNKKLG